MGFFDIFKLSGNNIAIDLGTANTLIYVKDKGVVVDEPSVVAVDTNTREIIAIGAEAKAMIGRTPKEKEAIRPLRDGVIADFTLTTQMIDHYFKKVYTNRFAHPKVLVAVPSGITEVEKRAVVDAVENAGADKVYLISEPMAAAVGVGVEVDVSSGNMIVDIGGGTTDIAVISLSGTVAATSLKVAGDEMNEAIIEYLHNNFRLEIGEITAEEIKKEIGNVIELDEELEIDVKGKSVSNPAPIYHRISSADIREALKPPVEKIIQAINKTLDIVPSELASDILERGIILTGGGSLLKGLDKKISNEVNLSVHVADEPTRCVVKGASIVLDNIEKYSQLLLK